MATVVTLYTFTDQGLRNIKDTVKRAEAIKEAAGKAGVHIKEILWLDGQYDILVIAEASDDAAAKALALNFSSPAMSARRRCGPTPQPR